MKKLGIIKSYSDRPTVMPPKTKGKTEKQVQDECMFYLDMLERQGVCYSIRTQSGAVKLDSGRFMKTGRKGCPDAVVCLKGMFIGIEFKKEKGGKWSETQQEAKEAIDRAGGKYLLITSLAELQADIKELLGL
jgi:hypothetical protein